MRKNLFEFIRDHDYVNYCEALIFRDGTIEYAKWGHVNEMVNNSGFTSDQIYKMMPVTASPIHWLPEFTGIVPIWYDMLIVPSSITEAQRNTINELKRHKIIDPNANEIQGSMN